MFRLRPRRHHAGGPPPNVLSSTAANVAAARCSYLSPPSSGKGELSFLRSSTPAPDRHAASSARSSSRVTLANYLNRLSELLAIGLEGAIVNPGYPAIQTSANLIEHRRNSVGVSVTLHAAGGGKGERVDRSSLAPCPDPLRRRGGRAVECGGLENRWARKRPGGSNPSPSASSRKALTGAGLSVTKAATVTLYGLCL